MDPPPYAVDCQAGVLGVTGENSVVPPRLPREKNLPERGRGIIHAESVPPFLMLCFRLARPLYQARAAISVTPAKVPIRQKLGVSIVSE